MAKNKTTPTPPEQTPIEKVLQRLAVLEAKNREKQEGQLRHHQFSARVYHPNYGQALPDGVGYHDYVIIRIKDEVIRGEVLTPSEDEVMALLHLKAFEEHPGHVRIELADISLLPVGW